MKSHRNEIPPKISPKAHGLARANPQLRKTSAGRVKPDDQGDVRGKRVGEQLDHPRFINKVLKT